MRLISAQRLASARDDASMIWMMHIVAALTRLQNRLDVML